MSETESSLGWRHGCGGQCCGALCTAIDDERFPDTVVCAALALRARARRQSSTALSLPAKHDPRPVQASDSDDESEDESQDEDEYGFVIPPGWRSERTKGNAYTWTDGSRTVSTITEAWEIHNAGSSDASSGGSSDEPLAEGLSVESLLDALRLTDDEAARAFDLDVASLPTAAPQVEAPEVEQAEPAASSVDEEQVLFDESDLPEEVYALLEDSDLQAALLAMLDELEPDQEKPLPPKSDSELPPLAMPPDPPRGRGLDVDMQYDGIDLNDLDD